MNCQTCNHDMTPIGCRVTERPFHWCPNCGTIKTCEEAEATAPAAVYELRGVAMKLREAISLLHQQKNGQAYGQLKMALKALRSVKPQEAR